VGKNKILLLQRYPPISSIRFLAVGHPSMTRNLESGEELASFHPFLARRAGKQWKNLSIEL